MPAKMSVRTLESRPAIKINITTDITDIKIELIKMNRGNCEAEVKYIAKTAPRAAKLEAPNKEGEAKGFLTNPCSAAPEIPNVAPIVSDNNVLGSRISHKIIWFTSDGSPEILCKISHIPI